jgi:hypothetical protein
MATLEFACFAAVAVLSLVHTLRLNRLDRHVAELEKARLFACAHGYPPCETCMRGSVFK